MAAHARGRNAGSGKTTFVRSLLRQFDAFGPEHAKLVVVDGKGDTDYLNLLQPGMFVSEFPDVQLGPKFALDVLRWAIGEMDRRRDFILQVARSTKTSGPLKATDLYRTELEERVGHRLAPLILVIDEFADIMISGGRRQAEEFENLVQRISQVGRSRLMHLILSTQRPDRETIRGAIKANLNARVVLRLLRRTR